MKHGYNEQKIFGPKWPNTSQINQVITKAGYNEQIMSVPVEKDSVRFI